MTKAKTEIKIDGLSDDYILHQAMCFGAEASKISAVEPPEEVIKYFSNPKNQAKTTNPIDLESIDGCVQYDGRQEIHIILNKIPKNIKRLRVIIT
ncbi:hypothetical protein LCGC14_0950310 [marine sediment metagenome]|uniref:Uncharacterized protein n=1 Tax=marine sediment metagenome TaxID=412755 RepID=A0A0F9P3N4_9ZZZZ|nr:hypothetical protein [Pricia sp.]